MSAHTKVWLATVSGLTMLAGQAMAQNDANVTIIKPGDKAEQAGQAVEGAVESTAEAAGDATRATVRGADQAAEATAGAAGDAAEAAGDAANAAADAAGDAAKVTVETVDQAAQATGEAARNAADAVQPDANVTVTTAAPAEGTPVEGQIFEQSPDTFLASTMMDGTVLDPTGETIGDVNDLVLGPDGAVTGVVIGAGGFLGLGQKEVAIELSRIEITQDENGDLRFVLNATEEELKAAPEFRTRRDIELEAQRQAPATAPATAPMAPATTPMMAPATPPATTPVEPAPAN